MDIPPNMSIRDMQKYIKDAVQAWKGGYDPQSPVFDLRYHSVKVSPIGVKQEIPEIKR